MSEKRILKRLLSVLICIAVLSAEIIASAAVLPFETQYDYDKADTAWLTDLVIKEDMTTVEGLSQRVKLIPVTDYPYTETPASFEEEVNYFVKFYDLDPGSAKAGYVYFLEALSLGSGSLSTDIDDSEVQSYLEAFGIKYPSEVSSDQQIMARALYLASMTGSFSGISELNSASLEEAVVSFLSTMTGMNMDTLREWIPTDSILTLDEYILAASKLTLWTNGYEITKDMPEDEVYRLIAVMTVEGQGISVDSSLTFEQLKLKYMATLLGTKYDVSVDSKKLDTAVKNNNTAFYILQLIGRKSGLSVREDNATYEEAFALVAENTGIFDVSDEDFYADIYTYNAQLEKRCRSIWVYPTAYSTGNENAQLVVLVNGIAVRNNYYNEVSIDPDKQEQTLTIVVNVSENGKNRKCTYTVNITQGTYENVAGDEPVTENESPTYTSSDSLVAGIMASLGLNSSLSTVINSSYLTLPTGLSGIVAVMAPTFDESAGEEPNTVEGSKEVENDEFFISILDELGALFDTEITGIDGIDFADTIVNMDESLITF